MNTLEIVEGVEGNYRYHIRIPELDSTYCGLPRQRWMTTELSWANWGQSAHLREKWCAECHTLALGIQETISRR